MNQTNLRQAAGLLTLLGVCACADPITDVQIDEWEPEVALPLLETSFTLRDALSGTTFEEYIEEDDAGALRIAYSERLFDVPIGERFPLIPLVFPLFSPESELDFGQLATTLPISRLRTSDNRAIVELRNPYTSAAVVDIRSDHFDLDGRPLRRTLSIPAGETVADTFDVARAQFDLGEDGMVRLSYEADLADGREGVQLSAGFFRLEPGVFEYAEGAINHVDFSLDLDSLELSFFDALEPGSISLVDPAAKLIVDNSVNAPVRLSLPDSYFGYRDGRLEALTSPLSGGLDFAYPAIDEGPVSKRSELVFNSSTSNFAELLSGLPTVLDFNFHCAVNADSLTERFSIHRDSRVSASVEIDVPLALEFNGFLLEQTFALPGSSFEQAADVEFLARVTNGFGLGVKLQATFYDAADRELLVAFPAPVQILEPAAVDALGKTTAATQTEVRIEIPREDIAVIAQASSMKVALVLDSPEGTDDTAGFTQLFYDNQVAIKLGALITLDGNDALAR